MYSSIPKRQSGLIHEQHLNNHGNHGAYHDSDHDQIFSDNNHSTTTTKITAATNVAVLSSSSSWSPAADNMTNGTVIGSVQNDTFSQNMMAPPRIVDEGLPRHHYSSRSNNTAERDSTTNMTFSLGGINDNNHEQQQQQQMLPYAILHVGPHKTGTTTIQYLTETLVNDLREDGYEMPWVEVPGSMSNVAQLAFCFYSSSPSYRNNNSLTFTHHMYHCDTRLLQAATNIAMRTKSNILLSAEAFVRSELNITLLKEFMKPWNVTVVYTYRRFYSWLSSYHNQLTKMMTTTRDLPIGAFHSNNTDYLRINITDYISRELSNVTNYMDNYQAVFRYKREYDNVIILNLQDKSNDVTQRFFCHAMPSTNNEKTCNALKIRLGISTLATKKRNKSQVMTYYDLAYRANRLGLLHIASKEQLDAAVEMIEQHQKVTLNLTDYDFDVVCPDRAILDELLDISLEMERLIVPDFFAGPFGESELRSDFEMQSKSSLCSVDLSGIIESSQWMGFFKSLNDRLHAA